MSKNEFFFLDKQNVLKGPFTEKQMQEWYRKGWFDSSFQIRIGDSGTFQSFGSLCDSNGVGCPFSPYSPPNNEEETLMRLEKDLTHLNKSVLCLKEMKMKIEDIEKQIKSFTVQSVTSKTECGKNEKEVASIENPPTVPKKKRSPTEEIDYLLRIMSGMGALDEKLRGCSPEQIERYRRGQMRQVCPEYKYREDWSYEDNWIAVAKENGQICPMCREPTAVTNPKQYILHIVLDTHTRTNPVIVDYFKKKCKDEIEIWRKEDEKLLEEGHNQYLDKKNNRSEFTPKFEFMSTIHAKLVKAFGMFNPEDYFDLFKSRMAHKLIKEVHTHLQSGIPACNVCEFVSRDINDYYRHMASYGHWNKSRKSLIRIQERVFNDYMAYKHVEKYFK